MKTKYWAVLLAGVLAVSLGLSFLVLLPRGAVSYTHLTLPTKA